MSNIYIQEPPTSGKVLLKTTVGDIDIELWTRECPKAARNFIQLCLEGYYNNTVFHRLVKGFIVQGGDPNGDGTGGESIYGAPFKDEFHSRLRYTRRGLVGMANSGKDDNASQFFFTLAATPELQNQNTLFGKITGDTIYNMLKLEESMVDHQERPLYTHRILRTEVLNNPFEDILPRATAGSKSNHKQLSNKKDKKGVKNFGLLSFGAEAEDDEQETIIYVKKNAGKAKSLHDAVDDPKLSKKPIDIKIENRKDDDETEEQQQQQQQEQIDEEYLPEDSKDKEDNKSNINLSQIKSKLTRTNQKTIPIKPTVNNDNDDDADGDNDEDELLTREQEQKQQISMKKAKIREEIDALKKEYRRDRLAHQQLLTTKDADNKSNSESKNKLKNATSSGTNHYIDNYLESQEKYTAKKTKLFKGQPREDFTLQLLSKFRNKLDSLKQKTNSDNDNDDDDNDNDNDDDDNKIVKEEEQSDIINNEDIEKDINGDNWLSHKLNFESGAPPPVLAKDASTKGDDWYDAYDPRNPLNKRKREANNKYTKSKYTKR